jgi:hypothetical protein
LEGERSDYRVLVNKTERKKPFGSLRRRCQNNNEMDLEETGWREWTGFILLKVGAKGRRL